MTRESATGADVQGMHLDWCHDAVQEVSRTFALTINTLSEPLSSRTCVGYLVCRIADTIEDTDRIPAHEKARLLHRLDDVLDPNCGDTVVEFLDELEPWIPSGDERDDDWTVVEHADRVLDTFNAQPDAVQSAMRPPVRELVTGMAMFVDRYEEEGGVRIQTVDELEEYCYYVASTVGHLTTNLVCLQHDLSDEAEEQLYDTAEEFGQLLQLTNISKDAYDDYTEENNIYLPAEWLAEEDVPQDRLLDTEHRESAAVVVERVADRARTYIDEALTYIETLPRDEDDLAAACGLTYLLAIGTLREVSETPQEALTPGDVKVSRSEVFAVMEALFDGSAQDRVADIKNEIAAEPFTG